MNKIYSICERRVSYRFGVTLFLFVTLAAVGLWFFDNQRAKASVPASGTINPVVGATVTWTGDRTGVPPAANGEPSCSSGDNTATNCDAYELTVAGTQAAWAGKKISIKILLNPADYDLVVRKESNGTAGMQGLGATNQAPVLDESVGSSGNVPGQPEEVVISPATGGVGIYYPRSVYFAAGGLQYTGTATVESTATAPPPSACAIPTFDNYQPPVNTPGTATPYPRRNSAGEPSIGINWNTGNAMTMHRLQASRTTWNDSTSPPNPMENTGHVWFPRPMPLVVTGLDPIGFTDSVTGRSIFGELSGNFQNSILSDDDFATFQSLPTQGISPTSSIDHQTIGGGPPNPAAVRQPTGPYPHMFYYAAQNIAYATVSTSIDGGYSWLPAVPAYTLNDCGGLHGHIKVSPVDGTVYLPNKGCGGKSGFARSLDNGVTWTVHKADQSTAGNTDPSIGIGSGGRVYFAYAGGDNHPHVAVTDDRGNTWRDDFDLGANLGITASVFPHAVAGDNDRAAVFFLGTTSTNPGDPTGTDAGTPFAGTWYPYIATTCDGGRSWHVVKADRDPLFPTEKNPVQQGVVCTSGTTCPSGTRNLLDFNEMGVDQRGRITAVYADGCNRAGVNGATLPLHQCMTNADNHPTLTTKAQNEASARMTIIRQTGGPRLFGAFDPGGPAPPPLPPPVNVEMDRSGALVKWAEPDNGGSPIRHYRIYRGVAGRGYSLVGKVKPGIYSFYDSSRKRRGQNVYYIVTAVNDLGESPIIVPSS